MAKKKQKAKEVQVQSKESEVRDIKHDPFPHWG